MTILILKDGLAVINPIAPTEQCLAMLRSLTERLRKSINYILLPTTQVEHKVYLAPFSAKFPEAQVWVVPSQWAIPPLPLSWIDYFPKTISGYLQPGASQDSYPWAESMEVKVLDTSLPGLVPTPFQEAAVLHKPSRSLLVTDAVVSITP